MIRGLIGLIAEGAIGVLLKAVAHATFCRPEPSVKRDPEELDLGWHRGSLDLPGAKQRRGAGEEGSVGGRARVFTASCPSPCQLVRRLQRQQDAVHLFPEVDILDKDCCRERSYDVLRPLPFVQGVPNGRAAPAASYGAKQVGREGVDCPVRELGIGPEGDRGPITDLVGH